MREVCNAEWDDIQDRLKEKDAEIERLSLPRMENPFEAEHNRLMHKVAVLKALLTRAADALDIMTQFLLISDVPLEWEENKRRDNAVLIAELRKAAG